MRFLDLLHGQLPAPTTAFTENLDVKMKYVVQPRKLSVALPRDDYEFVVQYGRPLWQSLERGSESRTWTETLGVYAASKLLGGKKPHLASSWAKLTEAEFFAVLMSRIAGYVVPFEDAEKLVRSHMAIARKMSQEKCVVASYGSEPLLAGGSKELCLQMGGLACVSMVQRLTRYYSKVPANGGDIGELAAAMILLKAMDKCCENTGHSERLFPACSVTTFLDVLLGSRWRTKVMAAITSSSKFMDPNLFLEELKIGTVSFNHFFRISESDIDWPAVLSAAHRRCGAIILPKGFLALDIVIPIAFPNGLYSGIVIQVKNTAASFPAIHTLRRGFAFSFGSSNGVVPGLFLGLRTVAGRNQYGRADVITRGGTALAGYVASSTLDLACLSPEEVDALEELCALHRENDSHALFTSDGSDHQPVHLALLQQRGAGWENREPA